MDFVLLGLAVGAGIATVLSPCILPILPILVGRALQSHRLGPVALVSGLGVSFALTGSLLGLSAEFLGPLSSVLRQVAIVVLLLLGLGAAFPALSTALWGWVEPLMAPFTSKLTESDGSLWAEFLVGTQLGLVWVPCAGPILGSIFTLVAVKQAVVPGFLALLCYALGAAIPMLALAYGGRTVLLQVRKLYPHTAAVQRIAGMGVALAALAILLGWDNQLQLLLAPLFPAPLL
jgi:cytochrome c-type biogenesis protein